MDCIRRNIPTVPQPGNPLTLTLYSKAKFVPLPCSYKYTNHSAAGSRIFAYLLFGVAGFFIDEKRAWEAALLDQYKLHKKLKFF
jgi:hypothetical protein